MATPADITDPTFRAAMEEADRLLDAGDFTGVAKKCGETYVLLLEQRPDLLPAPQTPTPGAPVGTFRSYLRAAPPTWPRTGGLNVVVGEDRKPRLVYDKERFSFSEAAGYYEFLMNQFWRLQNPD
jgi:hypothetical protein